MLLARQAVPYTAERIGKCRAFNPLDVEKLQTNIAAGCRTMRLQIHGDRSG